VASVWQIHGLSRWRVDIQAWWNGRMGMVHNGDGRHPAGDILIRTGGR
jgi:hypothetical protein